MESTWMTKLSNMIITGYQMPEDRMSSTLVPVFKGKGEPLECGSYRAIKLLEHAMKIVGRVLESRLREQVNISSMQFGFTPGNCTTDEIFVVWEVQEKYMAKANSFYYAFVDLEKAYDRVPREVTRSSMRRAGVE